MSKNKNLPKLNLPRGELPEGQPHPASRDALSWLAMHLSDPRDIARIQEAFGSVALSNNVLAEVCGETLRRCLAGETVSDRYVLGLAWTVRNIMELQAEKPVAVNQVEVEDKPV